MSVSGDLRAVEERCALYAYFLAHQRYVYISVSVSVSVFFNHSHTNPPPHTHTGTLSHYTTKHEYTQKGARIADTDSIVYTPDSDSDRGHGSDSFSFMVQLGAVTSKQCVITLVLDDQEEIKKPKAGLFSCLGCSGSKKGPKGDDYDDNECVYMYIRMFLSPPLLPPVYVFPCPLH